MKRSALEKHLRSLGCTFVAHKTRHDAWRGPDGQASVIGRHKEIAPNVVRAICKQLGIDPPHNPN